MRALHTEESLTTTPLYAPKVRPKVRPRVRWIDICFLQIILHTKAVLKTALIKIAISHENICAVPTVQHIYGAELLRFANLHIDWLERLDFRDSMPIHVDSEVPTCRYCTVPPKYDWVKEGQFGNSVLIAPTIACR